MKKTKGTAVLIAVIMLIASLSAAAIGCGKTERAADEIIIGTTASIERAVRDEYAYDMLSSGVSEMPLIAKSSEGVYSPLLASYSTEDSKNLTFTITEGLKWSDGVPVTAEDIVFSLIYEETEDAPAFTSGEAKGRYERYMISEDKTQVTLELASPNVKALDAMTTLRVRPKHIYENKTKQELTETDARVTCGPYVLDSFNKASNTLTFVINEHYPKTPNFNKITYRIFGSDEVMYTALGHGDLDFVWNYSSSVPRSYQTALGKNDKVTLDSVTASNCPSVLVFNNARGLFSDKNLRLAVSYALDYDAFKEYFGSPYAATPNRSFAPPSLTGYKKTDALATNLDKAAECMLSAGYVKKGNYWEKSGEKAEFALTVNAGKEAHVGYAEYVKTQLERLGISVALDSVDSTAYNVKTSNKFATEQGSGVVTMQAAIMGFTAYGMSNLGDMYIDGNHTVQGGAQVFSETLTAIRGELSSAKTLDEYTAAASRLQDFYAEEIPAIALFWDSVIIARASNLEGIVIDVTFGLNNVNQWFSMTKQQV